MICFRCGFKWQYKNKPQRVHRCYDCGNIFITRKPQGLASGRYQSSIEVNGRNPRFNYRKAGPCVYLLLTGKSTVYTGKTINIMKRLNQHVHGTKSAANHTSRYGVLKFLGLRYFSSEQEALRIEKIIHDNLFQDEKLMLARYWNSGKGEKTFPFNIWKAIQRGEEILRLTGKKRNSIRRFNTKYAKIS